MNYTHVHMPDSQPWYVLGNAVLYSFIHKSAAVRFFEYAAHSAGGERLRQEGGTSRSRGETGDIILLNESYGLSKMSLCALSYKRLCKHCNTGSSACAHVCACVCVPRSPRGGLGDTSALEIPSGGGSGLNSLPIRSGPDFEKRCSRLWDKTSTWYTVVGVCVRVYLSVWNAAARKWFLSIGMSNSGDSW